MPYLILVAGVVIGLYGLYRFFLNAEVKEIKTFFLSVAALIFVLGLLVLALTGRLAAALGLAVAIIPFIVQYNGQKKKRQAQNSSPGAMTRSEALKVLGLEEGAGEGDIQIAYKKLMQKVHPDSKGSDWMAVKLNEARDVLLDK